MPHEPIELSLVALPAGAGPQSGAAALAAGPGWFDSSWDLRRGLEVKESWPADAPLRHWIESFLGPQAEGSSLLAGVSFSAT
jgi:hypothetical protein